LAWYDNEWGFSNRMLDVAASWLSVKSGVTAEEEYGHVNNG